MRRIAGRPFALGEIPPDCHPSRGRTWKGSRKSQSSRKKGEVEKLGAPDRAKLAKELQDVMRAVLHLALYYDLRAELAASVDEYYRRVVSEGLVEPLADETAGSGRM